MSRLLRVVVLLVAWKCPAWAAPPNILLVTIDTLRADHVGAYGYKYKTTPNLDALARQGVRFARAYTPVPLTLPAHAALLTGLLPPANGMRDFSSNRLPEGVATLAELLRARGYRTGAVLGAVVLDSRFGLNRGFDFYDSPFRPTEHGERVRTLLERKAGEVVEAALQWLDANRSGPFFLWVHLYDPHDPYEPPEPYRSQHAGRPYDGEIAYADAEVGRLLTYLRNRGLEAQTSIVVTSDHGEGLGEHGEKTHGFFIYDTTLHVPLLMKLDGRKGAVVVETPVSLIDVMPTLLRHAGAGVPAQVQGRSLLGVMAGRRQETALYAETELPRIHFGWSDLKSLRKGRYKYIQAPRPEFYDLGADPGENHNLAARQMALANSLRGELERLESAVEAAAPPRNGLPEDPALVEQLKSLGYVALRAGSTAGSSAGLPDPKDRVELFELMTGALQASQRGQVRESMEKLERATKIEPDSFTLHYVRGINYFQLREFPRAVEEFKQVLAKRPDYHFAIYYMALAYAQQRDYAAAQVGFERTLQLDPSNFMAAYSLGEALVGQRKLAEARRAFERAMSLNTTYPPSYNALGETQMALGSTDEAIASFRKALELAPNFARARQNLERALEGKAAPQ